tara:strand:+ start:867 stop:1487 length:621 start_codon:yes stop_codon:yes gene_type:complete
MANTTFSGPVRSEGGFEQITISSAGVATTNLDIDSSGNIDAGSGTITTTGAVTFSGAVKSTGATNILSDYESITAATKTLVAGDSNTIYGFNRAAGIVVTLPTPAAGITYTFLVETTFTGAGQIKTATTDGTDGFLGNITMFDTGQVGETDNFQPAASNDIIDLGQVEQGWLTGGIIRLYGVNTTTWFVDATLMGDGTLATPFVDS